MDDNVIPADTATTLSTPGRLGWNNVPAPGKVVDVIDQPATHGHDELSWQIERVDGCVVATPAGPLTSLTYRDFRDMLIKFALDTPRAVIVPIDQLDLSSELALTAFSSAALRVSDWPGITIMIVTGRADRLAGNAIHRFVPVFPDVTAAVAAVGAAPLRRRAVIELDHDLISARRARLFVRSVCSSWQIGELRSDAEQIATELVENAVQHTLSQPRLRLELRSGLLTVAVGDDSAGEAVFREQSTGLRAGGGLRIVADRAKIWGCSPELGGGKVVWAVLRTSDRTVRLR
jgi:hypothetical protein